MSSQPQEYVPYYSLKSDIIDMISKQNVEHLRAQASFRKTSVSSSSSATLRPISRTQGTDAESSSDSEPETETDEWATESMVTAQLLETVETSDAFAGRRHGGYGLVTFSSEDEKTAWHDHPSAFTRESLLFAKLFSYDPSRAEEEDPCKGFENIERVAFRPFLHFRLRGISDWEFESFLIALRPRLGEDISPNRLPPILFLSTLWSFPNIRQYALNELPKHIPTLLKPIETVILARKAEVPEWLSPAYVKLCVRPAPITLDEARILGVDATLAISRARERLLERRMGLIIGPPPATLFGYSLWSHPKCWATLSEAWRLSLTASKYRDGHQTTKEAVAAVLDDCKLHATGSMLGRLVNTVIDDVVDWRARPGRLCSSCDNISKIEGWIGMKEDENLAKIILKEILGDAI